MNIRIRFTLLFTLIVGTMLCFFSFAIYYLSEDHRQEDFHSRLKNRAIEQFDLLMKEKENAIILPKNKPPDNNLHSLTEEQMTIYNAHKKVIYTDNNTPVPASSLVNSIFEQDLYTWTNELREGIGFTHIYQGKTYILFISATDKHGKSYIVNLKKTLTVRLFIIMLIVFISGWIFAEYFTKPLINIVKQTDKITSKNLSYRIKTKHEKDEIGQLATTFNKMLDRLETAFTIQKRFVSNASHELRNPLTAISGKIDVTLMKDRSKEEYHATLVALSVHIKNLRTLTNNLLELANSDVDTLFQDFEEIRIDEVLWSVRDEMQKQNPDCVIKISFEEIIDNEKVLTCKGKAKLLEIAFVNILDNACKFSNNQPVTINVKSEKRNILLQFIDQGMGIPESYLTHVFEPFSRGSNTHHITGKGVGLSLVRGIVKLHNGKIFIQSTLHKGTKVEILLPNLS